MKSKFISLLILLSSSCFAQDDYIRIREKSPKKPVLDKVFVGGNVGLQYGYLTFIEISPIVGYRFTDKIAAGIGAIYQYYDYKDGYSSYTTNVYGGRIFGRCMITNYLFGYAEYDYMNLENFDLFFPTRVDVGNLLAGGGVIQRVGSNLSIVTMVLYNFNESVFTPYQNPVIRVGVNVNLR